MPTQAEELQAKEFLKRAEVRTMKKDLRALREFDALKERDKIARIKTLEEQLEEKKKLDAALVGKIKKAPEETDIKEEELAKIEQILEKNEDEEKIAEKDLKNYATEEERQQIFLLESQRFAFEEQVDEIDKQKDPSLKLQENGLLLKKRDQQARLNEISEEEEKLEQEQKAITDKEKATTIAAERKGLEKSRSELEKRIEAVEKKRWEAERQIQETNDKISQVNVLLEQNSKQKNDLKNKVLGADKSLRDLYSAIMTREEEKRKGQAQEQLAKRAAGAEVRAEKNEQIQRQQWANSPQRSAGAPQTIKEKLTQSFKAEDEQRKKFLQDIDSLVKESDSITPPEVGPKMREDSLPRPPVAPKKN